MMARLGLGSGPAVILACGLAAALPRTAAAQAPTIEFSVSGSSTVRNWTCSAQGTVAITPATAGTAVPGFDKGVELATVTVPLKAFRCPNEEMTQHLNEAMKSDKFPEIVYKLEKYTVAGTRAEASGTMTITGNSQPVTVPLTFTKGDQGVVVEGNTRLELPAYGIEPPTVFLGMLKVGPQIRIAFKSTVTR
jgi:polyisoprenoid-binding protein YceI